MFVPEGVIVRWFNEGLLSPETEQNGSYHYAPIIVLDPFF
jgi:hypothetical protein